MDDYFHAWPLFADASQKQFLVGPSAPSSVTFGDSFPPQGEAFLVYFVSLRNSSKGKPFLFIFSPFVTVQEKALFVLLLSVTAQRKIFFVCRIHSRFLWQAQKEAFCAPAKYL